MKGGLLCERNVNVTGLAPATAYALPLGPFHLRVTAQPKPPRYAYSLHPPLRKQAE